MLLSSSTRALRFCLLATLALPLACAVGTTPDESDSAPLQTGVAGSGLATSGSSHGGGDTSIVMVTTAGRSSGTSGSAATAGASSGSSGSSGSPGSSGSSGTAGSSGAHSTAGASSGGSGGAAGSASASGSGPVGSGCSGVKEWKSADSTLHIAAGEIVQWMGKRYKAKVAIEYPNAECAPDKPVMWCSDWFMPDGSC